MVQQLKQLVELAEVLIDITMDVISRTELLIKLTGGTEFKAQVEIQQPEELKAQVKIWQLEELKVFNTLRLSIEVLIEVFPEVLADIAVEVNTEVSSSL